MAIKAVLFDFWGTLAENGTYSPTKGTLRILRIPIDYKEFIVRFENAFFTKSYPTQEDAFRAVCDEFRVRPLPIVLSKMVGLWNKNKLFARPYPETVEALASLKERGLKLAVVSNTQKGAVEDVIAKHNLKQYFDAVVLSCEHGVLKQEGKLYDIALEQLGVSKDEAIVVGDSIETDLEGAKAAGIKGILIDRKGRREYPDKIATLNEVENFL
ncbi:MAG TPA: HAD family hydrolase [Candidatus Binatia bacterium]|nr:HAD family hydrolase [Candidatus Binatia bacterium]